MEQKVRRRQKKGMTMGSDLLFLLLTSAGTQPSVFNQQPFNNLACLVFR
jgi:hypothetical protein